MGWWKDMGKTWLFKSAKSVGRSGANVIEIGAPIAGNFFFGPVGGLVGTGVAAGAGQVGPNKNRTSQLKRDLTYGLSLTAATSALSLATGGGFFGNSIWKSATSIFGGAPAAAAPSTAGLSPGEAAAQDLMKMQGARAGSTLDPASAALQAASAAVTAKTGLANTAQLQQQYQEQLDLAAKLRAAGDQAGALQAAGMAEGYRQAIQAAGGDPNAGGGFPWGVILIAGAAFFILRGKKS